LPTPMTSLETTAEPADRPRARGLRPEFSRAPAQAEEIELLKRSLQELRQAVTLLNAQVQVQTEAREAIEAQLLEANAEIAASWNRRKEMAAVIQDRDAKLSLAEQQAKQLALTLGHRDARVAHLNGLVERLKGNTATLSDRVATLKDELHARYSELAHMQKLVVRNSLSGRFRRAVRQVTRLLR
jgi:chromosome segregation ATPase